MSEKLEKLTMEDYDEHRRERAEQEQEFWRLVEKLGADNPGKAIILPKGMNPPQWTFE